MHWRRTDLVVLIEAARAGDERAWDEVYRRFESLAWKEILPRVRRKHIAADLVQDAFILAFRKLFQLRQPERFGSWLRQIARNVAFNWLGPKREPMTCSGVLPEIQDPYPGPLEILQREESVQQIHAGLARLRPIDREALEAYYFDRQRVKEIAARIGKPEGTIKRRLHDARRRLRGYFSPCSLTGTRSSVSDDVSTSL